MKKESCLDIDQIRKDFPSINGKRALIYFDSAATSLKPACVIKEVNRYLSCYGANIHRGLYYNSHKSTKEFEISRNKTAEFIGALSEKEIIFTPNTTASINIAAKNLKRLVSQERREILVPLAEHHSNILPWMKLKEEGFTVKFVSSTSQGVIDLKDYNSKLSSSTAIAVSALVSNVTGIINPVEKMAKAARKAGALFLVDAAQAAARIPIDVHNPSVDFLAFSAHKMYALPGVGVLYARKDILQKMEPVFIGGGSVENVWETGFAEREPPYNFEGGTPDIPAVIAIGTAMDYILKLGLHNIMEHEKMLLTYTLQLMSEIEGITLYGPKDTSFRTGIISFNLEGWDSSDLPLALDKIGNIAVRSGMLCAQPLVSLFSANGVNRISFSVFNTKGEIQRLCEVLSSLALLK